MVHRRYRDFSVINLCIIAGLAKLEQWCIDATEYAGSALHELRHIRQTVDFLLIHAKPKKTVDDITSKICPVLSVQQLYRISTMYWDDKYGTRSVSSDVLEKLRIMSKYSNYAISTCFVLEDDSIPFKVDDISESMQHVDVNDIEPSQLIRENPSFSFLLTREEGRSSVLP
ncbi:PREDICTED: myosin-17-like [Camelina sativa]|uniref:Myosin-17-like n=1 Tax=Camelina sativa TaxID=90675 RepID=A0ABM1REE8_CAMSA|nr:PREDICTED: myosin-17-like [Camelina sativa]